VPVWRLIGFQLQRQYAAGFVGADHSPTVQGLTTLGRNLIAYRCDSCKVKTIDAEKRTFSAVVRAKGFPMDSVRLHLSRVEDKYRKTFQVCDIRLHATSVSGGGADRF
jgi:hypothetical protein